jgi:hypothetical protein
MEIISFDILTLGPIGPKLTELTLGPIGPKLTESLGRNKGVL